MFNDKYELNLRGEELPHFNPRRQKQIDEALKDLVGANYFEGLGFPLRVLAFLSRRLHRFVLFLVPRLLVSLSVLLPIEAFIPFRLYVMDDLLEVM